jgi:hypothetical protein
VLAVIAVSIDKHSVCGDYEHGRAVCLKHQLCGSINYYTRGPLTREEQPNLIADGLAGVPATDEEMAERVGGIHRCEPVVGVNT